MGSEMCIRDRAPTQGSAESAILKAAEGEVCGGCCSQEDRCRIGVGGPQERPEEQSAYAEKRHRRNFSDKKTTTNLANGLYYDSLCEIFLIDEEFPYIFILLGFAFDSRL